MCPTLIEDFPATFDYQIIRFRLHGGHQQFGTLHLILAATGQTGRWLLGESSSLVMLRYARTLQHIST